MNVHFTVKQLELTPALRSYAEKKISKLERYLPNVTAATLELQQYHQKQGSPCAELQLTVRDGHGAILRAEDKSQTDPFAGIDMVVDKMVRQISRYKGKRQKRAGDKFAMLDPDLAMAEAIPAELEADDDDNEVVVRRKEVETAPMDEMEAIDQMEMLGHTFFMFLNANTGAVNVVYRRHAGGYGILEPITA